VEHPRAQVPEIDNRDLVLEGGSRKGPLRKTVKGTLVCGRETTKACIPMRLRNRVFAGGTDYEGKDDKGDNRNRRRRGGGLRAMERRTRRSRKKARTRKAN
jgi:hypothetical protein